MAAPKEIADLVERFERDQSFYKSAQFNETELRTRFINPLIAALGWDVYHDRPCRADQHEVKEEDSVEVEGKIKNPDYSFRLFDSSLGSMKRKFFVEVKRPSVNIEAGAYPAFQLRRYAWSADLPISILTDFEELSEGQSLRQCQLCRRPSAPAAPEHLPVTAIPHSAPPRTRPPPRASGCRARGRQRTVWLRPLQARPKPATGS